MSDNYVDRVLEGQRWYAAQVKEAAQRMHAAEAEVERLKAALVKAVEPLEVLVAVELDNVWMSDNLKQAVVDGRAAARAALGVGQ